MNMNKIPAILGLGNTHHKLFTFVNESLPNIYELNDKRYEIQCLDYIRNLKLYQYDILIADGGSCEALLRYSESEKLKSIVLIDSPEIYTAGERHGRDFHHSSISLNCEGFITFIATSKSNLIESQYLHNRFPKQRTSLYFYDSADFSRIDEGSSNLSDHPYVDSFNLLTILFNQYKRL